MLKTKSFPTIEQFRDEQPVTLEWLTVEWGAEISGQWLEGVKYFRINRVYTEGRGAKMKGIIYQHDMSVNAGIGTVENRGSFRLQAAAANVFELGSNPDRELRGFDAK